jgi:predicted ATP-dependent protease
LFHEQALESTWGFRFDADRRPEEKSLAAMRAGISTVIIPKLNEKDLVDVPEEAKQKLKFVPLENVDEVLVAALEKNGATEHRTGGSASPKTMAR